MLGFLFTVLGGWMFGPWGALAGSLLGGLLSRPKTPQTPAPDPPTAETFSYGVPIKKIWNQYRCGGTRVWQTDIRVVRKKGKKHSVLFGSYRDPDTFEYRASWSVVFCQGPIHAILKIWADGKLIYDVSDEATAQEVATSRASESGTQNKIVICTGEEDQESISELVTADPDNTHPAYRGRAMVVFYNWELTRFGGRIPEINAWVLERAEVEPDAWEDVSTEMIYGNEGRLNAGHCVGMGGLWMVGGYKKDGGDIVGTAEVQYAVQSTTGQLTWDIKSPIPDARGELEVVHSPYLGIGFPEKLIAMGGYVLEEGSYYDAPDPMSHVSKMVCELGSINGDWFPQPVIGDSGGITEGRIPFPRHGFAACSFLAPYPWGLGIFVYGGQCTRSDEHKLPWVGTGSMLRDFWFYNEGNTWQNLTEIKENEFSELESDDGGAGYRMKATMIEFKEQLFLLGGIGPGDPLIMMRDVYRLSISPAPPRFVIVNSDVMATWPDEDKKSQYYISGAAVFRNRLIALMSESELSSEGFGLWASDDGINWELWNKGHFTILSASTGKYVIDGDHQSSFAVDDTLTAVGSSTFYEHTVSGVALVNGDTEITVDGGVGSTVPSGELYVHMIARKAIGRDDGFLKVAGFQNLDGTLYLVGGVDGHPRTGLILINKVDNSVAIPETITLEEVVSDLCTADAGIEEDLIDASQLVDTVPGVCASNRPTVQQTIEQLRQYGFFDMVESDGILKCVRRGMASLLTIDSSALGADDPQNRSGDRHPEKLAITYEQVDDLPRSVEVIYADADQAGLEGAQRASRSVGDDGRSVTLNLTILMDADRAARVAEINLWEYWASRAVLNWQTAVKYLHLDPADVVTLNVDGFQHITRIKQIEFGAPGILKFQSVMEEPHIYDSALLDGLGVQPPPPYRHSLLLERATTGVFLDIPILYKKDDTLGFYFGAYPSNPSQEELDSWLGAELFLEDDGDLIRVDRVYDYCTVGTVPTALPAGVTNIWDRVNVIEVQMLCGTPGSETEDRVLDGANLAVVGREIIQFCNAVHVSGTTWRLSTLLRGLFGTEHEVSQHGAMEQFVLLEFPKIQIHPLQEPEDLGRELTYRVVHLGNYPDYAPDVKFTCNGVGKKPLSPAYLEAQRIDGAWRITWMRRTRGIRSWTGGIPLPLMEEKEIYEIDFLVNGEVVHTQEIEVLSSSPERKNRFTLPVKGFDYTNLEGITEHQYGQDEIFGGVANSLHIRLYQISAVVGRGFPAEGTFTV